MSGLRVDVNLILGPWPTDAHAEWGAGEAERHLDRFGAAAGLVRSSVALEYDAAEGNRRLLDAVRAHPRLLPAVVLGPLESGEHGLPSRLPASLEESGARAVWPYPCKHGWQVTGLEAASLLAELRGAALPIFVELDELDWSGIDHLAAALPDVDIVVAGIGYRTLRQALPVLDRRPRVCVDLSYTASLDGIELLVRRYGANRVLLGTGAPARDDAASWFLLDHSDLSADERRQVIGGNAARLLRLTPSPVEEVTPQAWIESRIVDAHAHIGSWPTSWLPHPDVNSLLPALRRCGTSHAVISHLAAIWADAAGGNAAAIHVAEAHPNDLSVYLVANPNRPQDEDSLAEQLRSAVVRGFKVHPDTHHCPIDDDRFEWIWRLAESHQVPVLGHGFAGTNHSDPHLFGAVADRHPGLSLMIGHSGATVEGFRRTIDVARRHDNLYAETCGSWMTGRWLRRLVDALGPYRVVHGTDACLIDPRYGIGRVLGAGLPADDASLVLGGNARRLLRLAQPQPVGGI